MIPRSNEDFYGPVITGPPPSDQNYFHRLSSGEIEIKPHAAELTDGGYLWEYECPEGHEISLSQSIRELGNSRYHCRCGVTHVLAGISPEG